MSSPKKTYDRPPVLPSYGLKEEQLEYGFIVPDLFGQQAKPASGTAA